MESKEIIIKEEMLPKLAQIAGPEVSMLSPWARDYTKIKADSMENLKEAEEQLYLSPGQLRQDLAEAVELLKKPVKYVRLRLLKGPLLLEHIVYSCSKENSENTVQVSLTLGEGQLTLRNPAPLELLMVGLLEHWGDSSITSSALQFKLKRSDALVLAALIDLHRRTILADRSLMRKATSGHFSFSQIVEALKQTPPDNQWLISSFSAYMKWGRSLSEQEIKNALTNLEGTMLATNDDGSYNLIHDAQFFANHFLLVGQALQLEAGAEAKPGKVVRSNMLCLQGGLHENLYLEADGEFLVGEVLSGHYLASLLDRFLAGDFTLQEALPQQDQEPEIAEEAAEPPVVKRMYYIGRGEKSYGPYSWEEMVSFAAKGNLVREDLVWINDQNEWVRADYLEGLFN
jgi:hypothetical protein